MSYWQFEDDSLKMTLNEKGAIGIGLIYSVGAAVLFGFIPLNGEDIIRDFWPIKIGFVYFTLCKFLKLDRKKLRQKMYLLCTIYRIDSSELRGVCIVDMGNFVKSKCSSCKLKMCAVINLKQIELI